MKWSCSWDLKAIDERWQLRIMGLILLFIAVIEYVVEIFENYIVGMFSLLYVERAVYIDKVNGDD